MRHLIRVLGFQSTILGLTAGLLCAPSLAGGAELSLNIQPGIEQKRNYGRDEHWTRQWVRRMPPEDLPCLLIVQGPNEWLSRERPVAPAEVGTLNAEHAEILRDALAQNGLLTPEQPVLLAGRIVSLLRPMETDGATAPARRVRVWPLWEVLAYSPHTDTLSVAVAAAQTLQTANVQARIARYPTIHEFAAFGILVPAPAGENHAGPWALRAGRDHLLPVALSARPVADLKPEDLTTWTWQEILAPGWDPKSTSPESSVVAPPSPDPPLHQRAILPDPCRQAEALNLECVSGDPETGREQTFFVLATLTLLFLTTWLASLLYRRRLRLLRVWRTRHERRRDAF